MTLRPLAETWLPRARRVLRRLPAGFPLRDRLLALLAEMDAIYLPGGYWRRYLDGLEPGLLASATHLPPEERKRLFKGAVRIVEFEPHAYCNRKCPFCPNAVIDRVSNRAPLDFDVYIRALDELAALDYDGLVRYARFSEPLACETIDRYLSEARARLPRAKLDIVSNGDYLNASMLERLVAAGLDTLHISIYPKGYRWDEAAAQDQLDKLCARAGLTARRVLGEPTHISWVLPHPGLSITADAVDLQVVGHDRAQSMPEMVDRDFVRLSPCAMVFNNVTVDYDGSMMPCCNLRGDIDAHKGFIVGNLREGGIVDLFLSEAMAGWRRSLAGVDPKEDPCRTCKQKISRSSLAHRLLARKIDARLGGKRP